MTHINTIFCSFLVFITGAFATRSFLIVAFEKNEQKILINCEKAKVYCWLATICLFFVFLVSAGYVK